MQPRSLLALTLLFLAVFLASIVLTGTTTFLATRNTIEALVDKRLEAVSETLVSTPPHSLAAIAGRARLAAGQRDTADLGMILRARGGRILFSNIALSQPVPLGFSALDESAGIRGLTEGRVFVRDLGRGATLAVIGETEPIDNYNAARFNIYLVGFGSIVIIVLGGVAAFGVTIARRISALNSTADAIIDGDLSRRVPDAGTDSEFDRQARTLNRMLDRINELIAEISSVTRDIAHDLRTPLARLRGHLLALGARAQDEDVREGIESAVVQSDDLLAMFTAMLRIAEIEGEQRRAGFAELDVSTLVDEIVMLMEPVAADTGHALRAGIADAAKVNGDRQLLTQALVNLVENALRYTPPGSAIVLGARRTVGRALVTVTDNGPGIPPEQRTLALRHFGRLNQPRTGEGHGLGLPMVQAIARLHRGDLVLADAGPGLCVTIDLPLA